MNAKLGCGLERPLLAAVLLLLPATALAQEDPAAGEGSPVHVLLIKGEAHAEIQGQAPRPLVYGDSLPAGVTVQVALGGLAQLLEPKTRQRITLRGECSWVVGAPLPEGAEGKTLGKGFVRRTLTALTRRAARERGTRPTWGSHRGAIQSQDGPLRAALLSPSGVWRGTTLRFLWWADSELPVASWSLSVRNPADEGQTLWEETVPGESRALQVELELPGETLLGVELLGHSAEGEVLARHVARVEAFSGKGRMARVLLAELDELEATYAEDPYGVPAEVLRAQVLRAFGLKAQALGVLASAARASSSPADYLEDLAGLIGELPQLEGVDRETALALGAHLLGLGRGDADPGGR